MTVPLWASSEMVKKNCLPLQDGSYTDPQRLSCGFREFKLKHGQFSQSIELHVILQMMLMYENTIGGYKV